MFVEIKSRSNMSACVAKIKDLEVENHKFESDIIRIQYVAKGKADFAKKCILTYFCPVLKKTLQILVPEDFLIDTVNVRSVFFCCCFFIYCYILELICSF